jgi:uncharacterized RDD family membrane protein YckC
MSSQIEYETPENVRLSYKPAGLGTRFSAWLLDMIILNVAMVFLFIAFLFVGAALDDALRPWIRDLQDYFDSDGKGDAETALAIMIGIGLVIWGFSSFIYFGLSELFLRGQTIGKKAAGIRVVRSEGFALDAVGIFVRNIFRVVDQVPVLWLVPLISARSQRFGDMVSGTIVVSDAPQELSDIRTTLSTQPATEARFRFDNVKLGRLKPGDFATVEQVLDRWPTLRAYERQKLGLSLIESLCRKMQLEELPGYEDHRVFLEDLLAAEFRRQDRQLR